MNREKIFFIAIIFVIIITAFIPNINAGTRMCAQVFTDAYNPATGEYMTYPTSCLPEGWIRADSMNLPLLEFVVIDQSGKRGENIVVSVRILNRVKIDSLYTITFDVNYNKTFMSLVSIEKGSLIPGWSSLFNIKNDKVSFVYAGNGTEISPEKSGEIAKLNFILKDEFGSQSSVGISNMQVGNNVGDVGEVHGRNGSITMVAQ